MKSTMGVIAVLSIVSGLSGVGVKQIVEMANKPNQHEEFIERKFIKGILMPEPLIATNKWLTIQLGSNSEHYLISALKQGVEFKSRFFECGSGDGTIGEPLYGLKFKIFDNRLYVSLDLNILKMKKL